MIKNKQNAIISYQQTDLMSLKYQHIVIEINKIKNEKKNTKNKQKLYNKLYLKQMLSKYKYNKFYQKQKHKNTN